MTAFDGVLKVGQSLGSAASSAYQNAGPAAAKGAQLAKAFGAAVKQHVDTAMAHQHSLSAYEGLSPDWAVLSQFSEDAGKQIHVAAGEAWSTLLLGGNALGAFTQDKGFKDGFKEEDLEDLVEKLKRWVLEHAKEAASLLACVAAAPIAVAVTPAVLGLIGFTPLGPAAGSLTAGLQSTMGPVAAGSAFAILQSAAMGGYGAIIVNAMAATGAVGGTCSIAATLFIHTMQEECADGDSKET